LNKQRDAPVRCRDVRERLQDFHDRGAAPQGSTALHLATCEKCAAFQAFLARLGAEAREAIEAPLAGLPAPDAASARRRAEMLRQSEGPSPRSTRRGWHAAVHRLPLLAAAAALVIAIGVGGGILAYGGYRQRIALVTCVSDFVDDLFVSQPLEGAEYWPATGTQDLEGLLADLEAEL